MTSPDDTPHPAVDLRTSRRKAGLAGRVLDRLLGNVRHGRIRVTLPSGAVVEKIGAEPGPEASMVVLRWRALGRVLLGGDIGFSEGHIAGDWTTADLTALIRFAARNTEALAPAMLGTSPLQKLNRLRHRRRANTPSGSRRNIMAHYDLGNAFYERWLDASMLYSSALFEGGAVTLEQAQRRKLDRIRDKLALTGGESVLEIGCGWGALAIDLAGRDRARVTGLTLSPAQLARARDAAERAGVGDRLDLRLQDYRDVGGTYDRVVSIEMFEAVGEAYWPTYFETVRRRTSPGGRAVLQVISIDESRFDVYRRNPDFIQKHVFPGGFLPTVAAFRAGAAAAGLKVVDEERFGGSYARTLATWRARFHAAWSEIAPLGFDDRFRRLWTYYLSYCEAGFEEGAIDVGLYTLEHA